jgi:uncharacterized SAM-dependent methyltransferase
MDHNTKQDYFSFFTKPEGADMLPYAYLDPHNAYDQLIKDCPDYYLFQDEVENITHNQEILEKHLSCITSVVEIGPGSTHAVRNKTLPILNLINNLHHYYAIDYCKTYLEESCNLIQKSLPNTKVIGLEADIMELNNFKIPELLNPKVFLFLGSTIGNFNATQQRYIIKQLSNLMHNDDILIFTFDTNADKESLLKAYSNQHLHNIAKSALQYFAEICPKFKEHVNNFDIKTSFDSNKNLVDIFFIVKEHMSFYFEGHGDIHLTKGQELRGIISKKANINEITSMLSENNLDLLESLSYSNRMHTCLYKKV